MFCERKFYLESYMANVDIVSWNLEDVFQILKPKEKKILKSKHSSLKILTLL